MMKFSTSEASAWEYWNALLRNCSSLDKFCCGLDISKQICEFPTIELQRWLGEPVEAVFFDSLQTVKAHKHAMREFHRANLYFIVSDSTELSSKSLTKLPASVKKMITGGNSPLVKHFKEPLADILQDPLQVWDVT